MTSMDRFERIPRPGDVLAGQYRVERMVAVGKASVILAAQHRSLGARVALKLLPPGVALAARAADRLRREAHALVGLSSPHVVRIWDSGELPNGSPFLVLELLEGIDLARLLASRERLDVHEAVDVTLQVCSAIACVHERGIVHRDIKPANLFWTRRPDGRPLIKLLDFGLCKEPPRPGDVPPTDGRVVGSPAYMSPEQVMAPAAVDHRADIWSLGVTLHELVSGCRPFEGETTDECFLRIERSSPVPVRAHCPEVPPLLETIISKCLEKDPDDRFQRANELWNALAPFSSVVSGRPVVRHSRQRVDRTTWRHLLDGQSAVTALADRVAPNGTVGLVSWLAPRRARA